MPDDDYIDAFYNFAELKKAHNVKVINTPVKNVVPKIVKKEKIKTPRTITGTEYVEKYKTTMRMDLVEVRSLIYLF